MMAMEKKSKGVHTVKIKVQLVTRLTMYIIIVMVVIRRRRACADECATQAAASTAAVPAAGSAVPARAITTSTT